MAPRNMGANPSLATGEVHVWQIPLAALKGGIQTFRKLLSPDETQRADRFHFERDRTRFIMARAAMRKILSGYLDLGPQEMTFSYGAKGKPELSSELMESGIQFNLSHSREIALLAIARGPRLGVDIEFVDHEFASEQIARHFFSAGEISSLLAASPAERTEAFFSCWTRKEAYIKALGEGLSVPLDSFDVAFGRGIRPALLQVRVDPDEVSRWSMYDIAVAEGYKSALVAEGKGHELRHLKWEAD